MTGNDVNLAALEESLNFIALALESDQIADGSSNLIKSLKLILSKSKETTLVNTLCKICEKWLSKELPAIPDMGDFVFRHLLMLCSTELSVNKF